MKFFSEENAELQHRMESFFQRLSEINEHDFEGKLSVILLGSLSRGEATWAMQDGRIQLLSDIEFFTVYPRGFQRFKEFDEEIQKNAHLELGDIESDLFHVDNTWVEENKLPKLERKLLTFDAQEFGSTVVGSDIKDKLPIITLKNINIEDIYDILIHRMFSVLYYGEKVRERNALQEYRYLLAKNSLDLMTVLLINQGILVSGFENRLNEIRKINKNKEEERYFSYCLDIKQSKKTGDVYSIAEMEGMFISLVVKLNKDFSIPFMNRFYNIKAIARRHLGMMKRSIQVKKVAPSRRKYLDGLIQTYNTKRTLSECQLLDNYILNGYPKPV